jgi:hypothetical protein
MNIPRPSIFRFRNLRLRFVDIPETPPGVARQPQHHVSERVALTVWGPIPALAFGVHPHPFRRSKYVPYAAGKVQR